MILSISNDYGSDLIAPSSDLRRQNHYTTQSAANHCAKCSSSTTTYLKPWCSGFFSSLILIEARCSSITETGQCYPLMGGRRGSLGPGWTHYLMAPGWPQLTSQLCHLQLVLSTLLHCAPCLPAHLFVLYPPFWASTGSGSSVRRAFITATTSLCPGGIRSARPDRFSAPQSNFFSFWRPGEAWHPCNLGSLTSGFVIIFKTRSLGAQAV